MRHIKNSTLIAEGNPKHQKSSTKELSDSVTSEEKQVNPMLRTSEEERHYRTTHGSALATQIALIHSSAQNNLSRGDLLARQELRSCLKIRLKINLYKLQK